MESNCSPQNNAFSLLELIVAVAILSIGITVALEAISFSARATGIAGDIINAVSLAKDKIQELEFQENQGSLNAQPQQATDKKDKFGRSYIITIDRDLSLSKLDLGIHWQRGSRKESIELNTYLR